MHNDDANAGNEICRLLIQHGKGIYRENLWLAVSAITPYGLDAIRFQYLALIFHGYLVEVGSKVYNIDM